MSSLRDTALRLGRTRAGDALRTVVGRRRVRALGIALLPSRRARLDPRASLANLRGRRDRTEEPGSELTRDGWVTTDPRWQPRHLREDSLARTAHALEAAGVGYALIRTTSATRYTLAVREADRERLLPALAADPGLRTSRVQQVSGQRAVGRSVPVPQAGTVAWAGARVFRVFRQVRASPGTFVVGQVYGCDVEVWSEGPTTGVAEAMALTPRPNVAADALPLDTLDDTEPVEVGGRVYARPRVFGEVMLEDTAFEVDVVYTWVDGADPVWRERMLRTRARLEGVEFHPEASLPHRFTDREELRYSLRSLESYAPWVRHVWLVTDQQRPAWLAAETPGLTVVDHRDLVDDPSVLPLFNSNAIISRLGHIDGLAEHHLYLNDDVFLGRDVRPRDFFLANGVARLFPGRLQRPFGPPVAGDEPHINLSRNIRALLRAEFGVTITRAIRHTPHAQRRSRQLELEALFPEAYAAVLRHPFRHHDDFAADQLLQYYLELTGAGVPSRISYDYVNVGLAQQVGRLERLLRERDRAVFCLNDAPAPDEPAIEESDVRAFLEAYYPVPSRWET